MKSRIYLFMKKIFLHACCMLIAFASFGQGSDKGLIDSSRLMEQVVITASRVVQKRTEAPVAISVITKQSIVDTKAQAMDVLLNRVSGVYNTNLGNEQHSMSIRQPITTKSLFLYLEDGIPLRTTGVYNHNALLELNMAAAERIEVIKGPSSALYGAEAIGGVVNMITKPMPSKFTGNANIQFNNNGYSRADVQVGSKIGKFGFWVDGYYAQRVNGLVEYSNFNKKAINLKGIYAISEKLKWTNSLSIVDYYSSMTGALDSIKFSKKDFSTFHTFTYRSVSALRYRSTLDVEWNKNSTTQASLLYRDNSIGQNPSYSVGSTSNPLVYKGQINDNAFSTYAIFIQHVQKIPFWKGRLVVGGNIDKSPQSYYAKFIWIDRASPTGKFVGYRAPQKDSLLNNYQTNIVNTAVYANIELAPMKRLRTVISLRNDQFRYDFKNALPPTATSGGPSSVQQFSRFTPKLGFTYNLKAFGFYANYSQGYVPPQLNELFNSVKTPYLKPQLFSNLELGGWINLLENKLYIDWSIYDLRGKDEIVSVRLTDGTNQNQNAGKTLHKGIEYGINFRPNSQFDVRLSASNAKHSFLEYVARGINFNNKIMSGAPKFLSNAEMNWRPKFIKGVRLGAEWQHQSKYFMDDANAFTYKGFDLIHLRVGYRIGKFETWVNALNLMDAYYSTSATKSTASGNASYAYNLGSPREITLGVGLNF
jgi:outer membrane receptor protein involved in Fe transport